MASLLRVVVLTGGVDVEEAPDAGDAEALDEAADEALSDTVSTFPMVLVPVGELSDAEELDDAELVVVVAAVPTDAVLDEEAPEDEEADADVDDALALAEDVPFAVVASSRRVLASVNDIVGLVTVPPYTYPCAETPGAVGSPHLSDIDLTWDVKCPPAAA